VWPRSFVEVVGSWTGEFSDPPWHATQGEGFGGLTRRSQDIEVCVSKGATVQTTPWGFGATSTTIQCPSQGAGSGGATSSLYLALYAVTFK
jgi:hypothetical protein